MPDHDRIDSLEALEAVIGRAPPAIALKVIDHLDPHALQWLEVSPIALMAMGDATNLRVTLAGGVTGFATSNGRRLAFPLDAIDETASLAPGRAFASLFLVPGLGETLRINGRISTLADGWLTVEVTECYVHCAKALIRSNFWSEPPRPETPAEASAFLERASFLGLATVDHEGNADLSPKGDPPGQLIQLRGGVPAFADRPGNRRIDSFRNIVRQPCVATLALIPRSSRVVHITATARLTTSTSMRQSFIVREKLPKLVTVLENAETEVRQSSVLARLGEFGSAPVEKSKLPDPAATLRAHVLLNRDKGICGRITSTLVSLPGLMRLGLKSDYKNNLY